MVLSGNNLLVTGGTFTQVVEGSSREFEILVQRVATRARHDSGELSDPAKCHPDTRVAILTDLEEWAEGTTYNYPVTWITGSAGVGKTAVMRTLAAILERRKLLLADFFFWRTGERCNTAEFFIATLAYQISISIPETRSFILSAIKEDPHIFTRTLEAQSRLLIVDPIIRVFENVNCAANYPRILLIDGLDECLDVQNQHQDGQKQVEILQTLHWILTQLPVSFGLVMASRPEHHIQMVFDTQLEEIASSIMLDDEYDADLDIRRFYSSKFREIRQHHPMRFYLPSSDWPSPHTIDELTCQASGQFIYASTVVKFVASSKRNPLTQLSIILDVRKRGNSKPFQALDQLYSSIFLAIGSEDLPSTLKILGVLLLGRSKGVRSHRMSPHTFPPSFWDSFLGLPYGEVERLMLGLESILSVRGPEDQYFRFYHASLQDFLFDSERSGPFFIDKDVVYEDIARRSIVHLYSPNDEMEAYIISGMQFWFKNARSSAALHSAIEQTDTPTNPRYLKLRFPAFLAAIKGSDLSESTQLYELKYAAYRTRLLAIITLLYLQDRSLTFLILVAVGGGAEALGMTSKIVKVVYPLLPGALKVDLGSQGFCLYQDAALQDFLLKDVESIFDYNMFLEIADDILASTPENEDLYATAAARLIRSLTHLSNSCFPGNLESSNKMEIVVSNTLKYLLRRASTQSLNCRIKGYKIPQRYLAHIKVDIDEYILRSRLSQEAARQRMFFWDNMLLWEKIQGVRLQRALVDSGFL